MSETTQTVTDSNQLNNAKIKYKDTVFYDLFKNSKNFVEMYNAISGNSIDSDTANIEDVTISNAVYSNLKNDIGMKINDKLVVLIEQQSTWNNNMPLRFLGYLIATFKQQLQDRGIYGTKLMKIPIPEFYVIYNGPRKQDAEKTLKLSDSYDDNEKARFNGVYPLEILVKVININHESNGRILKDSKTLLGYQKLVSKVYEAKNKENDLNDAISIAVKWCIENDYLKDYLSKQEGVFDMLTDECGLALTREADREEGLKEGLEEGLKEGLKEGLEEGLKEGLEEGQKLSEMQTLEIFPKVYRMIEDKKSDTDIMDELHINKEKLEYYKKLYDVVEKKDSDRN